MFGKLHEFAEQKFDRKFDLGGKCNNLVEFVELYVLNKNLSSKDMLTW